MGAVEGRSERMDGVAGFRGAMALYGAAVLVILAGVTAASVRFPGGFDWVYTVISRLGSSRHNPGGAAWLTGSLLAAVVLLWPVTGHLERAAATGRGRPRFAIFALRLGLVGGGFLGLEGMLSLDLSRIGRKAHEILALVTFLSLYAGVLGLYARRMRESAGAVWPALLVVLPLCAVGVSQLMLYLTQRDLGWVNTGWRELGVPFWLSFAFWQWLAVAFLGFGLGALVATSRSSDA